jgi:hypothetical protein
MLSKIVTIKKTKILDSNSILYHVVLLPMHCVDWSLCPLLWLFWFLQVCEGHNNLIARLGGGGVEQDFNILTYSIFLVQNLEILCSKTQQQARDLLLYTHKLYLIFE